MMSFRRFCFFFCIVLLFYFGYVVVDHFIMLHEDGRFRVKTYGALSMDHKEKSGKCVFVYKKGALVCEKTGAFGSLDFLYSNLIGKFLRFFIRTHLIARLYAWYQNSSLSCWKISSFIKSYDIDMNDFIIPPGGYSSFNDFFVRTLKKDARSIDFDSERLVSPADSKLFVIPQVSTETTFFVKNKLFSLEKLLQDDSLAHEYEGGTLLLFRLAPYDYHRYHFPCAAVPSDVRKISGLLESVNPLVYRSGLMPLQENERQVVLLETKSFGEVAFVSVGAMFVGQIVQTFVPGQAYDKGAEMGYFSFGGSSLVLLFKKNTLCIDDEFVDHSVSGFETVVFMGQGVATRLHIEGKSL